MEYRHAALKIQYIVSKSRYHVLRFYKNNNRKHSISNACGYFEMVEATGVEPGVLKAIDDGISMFRRILLLSRLLRYASTRQAR